MWKILRIARHGAGYKYCAVEGGHPAQNCRGYVLHHRVVAENTIGRLLKPEEVVHHVNGTKNDNRPENLMVFATSADHVIFHRSGILGVNDDGAFISMTEAGLIPGEINKCTRCGVEIDRYATTCNACRAHGERRTTWPTKEELHKVVWSMPMTLAGIKFGVSANTIKKWCKVIGVERPKMGYWKRAENEEKRKAANAIIDSQTSSVGE